MMCAFLLCFTMLVLWQQCVSNIKTCHCAVQPLHWASLQVARDCSVWQLYKEHIVHEMLSGSTSSVCVS